MHLFGFELHRNLNYEFMLSNLPKDLKCLCALYKHKNAILCSCFMFSDKLIRWISRRYPSIEGYGKVMSPIQGRILVDLPVQYLVCPSARVMMGWLPSASAPTHLQRGHVLYVIDTHHRCCSPQIPLSPGSPLAVPARLLQVAALVLRPRSQPSCVAPARRPHSSPPPLIADNAHRHSSPPRGSTPRLVTPVSIILLSFLSRALETSSRGPPGRRRPRPVQWPAAAPPAARRSSPLSATAQARRPGPPGAPARHSRLQVISVGP
jgi:hypothetical protein